MVKHIFLTCGVLLSATAQTTFAKELEGMLVTQNNYVRIRSCDLKNNYTLLPGSGNGYEAAAEIISVRKNTPENTPIYVGLRGNLENTNFLISGIDFIKMGESCHVPHTETEDAKRTDTEKSDRINAGLATPEVSNTTAPTEKKIVENKEIDTSAKAEASETVEVPAKAETHETVEAPVKAEISEVVEGSTQVETPEKVETPTKVETSETVEIPAQTEASVTVETRVTTETTSTTQAPVVEETSTKAVDVEEHSSVSEPVAPVVLPSESQLVKATTVSEVKPETGKQESSSVEHEPLVPQVDIQREETHSAHNTLSATPMATETSASQTEPPVVNEETSVQPVYVNKVIVHDDVYE